MLRQILVLMRPGDWVKNVFVLPALIFALPGVLSGQNITPMPGASPTAGSLIGATTLAFIAFCLLSSGFYCINDVLDRDDDRLHPIKRRRPVASGAISPRVATGLGIGLIGVSLAMGFALNTALGTTLLLYAGLQSLYNVRLKRVCFVDVTALAIGFGLRAAAGAVAIEVQISIWLLMCVFFLCLYLGFVKRLCDIRSAEASGAEDWHSPAGYEGTTELNWLLAVSATLAVVTYLMYTLSSHARTLFDARATGLALLTPLVLISIHRFYRRALHGRSDSPFAALRSDRAVLASVVLFVAGTILTLYVPQVERILSGLFYAAAGQP